MPRIAQLLGWTSRRVKEDLKALIENGELKQNANGTYYLHRAATQYESYLEVRKLYQAIDKRLAEEFPDKVELSELSSVVREEARVLKKTAGKSNPEPTEVQLKLLTVIHEAFGRTQFTPLALGKAQGFTQAGWSKKYLETLARKGFAELVPAPGRGTTWQLTDAGVEWATR